MKKLILLFAAICCITMASAQQFTDNGIQYSVTGENTVEVIANNPKYSGDVVIPSTVTYSNTTYNVTGIGDKAFNSCDRMSSVTIPKGVTSIGAQAFMKCSILNSITIPEGVTSIGAQAFDNTGWYNKQEEGSLLYLCNYLVGVKGENTTTDIVIEDGTMTIADEALRGCNSLVSLTIPKSVTSIGDWAFRVETMESITVDSENHVYDSRNNCNAIIEQATNTLITGCKNTIIPSDVERIGNDAFRACEKLTSVTIPSGVTYIGAYAFFRCSNLTEIYVLATDPPTLGTDAFGMVPTGIPVYVPDVDAYKNISWGGFTNLIEYVDLPTTKEEAIAEINDAMEDITTFTEAEKQSIQLCKENINAATTLIEIESNKEAALFIIYLRLFKDEAIAELNDYIKDMVGVDITEYVSNINNAESTDQVNEKLNNAKALISTMKFATIGTKKYKLEYNQDTWTFGGNITINDKDFYQSGENFNVNVLTYTRTFNNTNWQAWFVPFDMTITDELLTDYEFAKFAGTYTDANGQFYITIVKMKSGDVLLGNRAFFIKSKSTGEKTFTPEKARILSASTSNHLEMYSAEQKIEVIGIYEEKTATADDCDWYAYGGGTYQKPDVGQTLNPMRFYLTITPRSDNYYDMPPAPLAKIDLMLIDGDEPTDINAISKSEPTSDRIYNLNGQAVGKDFKGVVIMNGKKYIKR